MTIPSRSTFLRKPGLRKSSGCNQSSVAIGTGWIMIPVSRNTYHASPASIINVCPSLPRSCKISARSASLSGLCSPRAREPNNIARSSRISAGIRARKSRTALSVSGSKNFIFAILNTRREAGNLSQRTAASTPRPAARRASSGLQDVDQCGQIAWVIDLLFRLIVLEAVAQCSRVAKRHEIFM